MDNGHEGFYSLQSAFYMKHLTSEMLKAVRWLGYTQSLKWPEGKLDSVLLMLHYG